MKYYEMTAKNICCLYFLGAKKRHASLESLYEFGSNLAKNLRSELKDTSINFLYSNYYLNQMCYDYDNLFEIDEEQLSLKRGISQSELHSQLGWMKLDVLLPCIEITNDYFGKNSDITPPQKAVKRETNERTLWFL